MDVLCEVEKLVVGFDSNTLIPSLEQRTDALVLLIKVDGIFCGKGAHEVVHAVL